MKDHTVQINSAENAEEYNAHKPLITSDPNVKSYSAVETTENGAIITSATTTSDVDSEAVKVIERRTWSWRSQSYKRSLASLIILLIVCTALQYLVLKLNLPAADS
jgi:hypothetical protein